MGDNEFSQSARNALENSLDNLFSTLQRINERKAYYYAQEVRSSTGIWSIIGGAAGAIGGFLVGGPPGAIAGGAAGAAAMGGTKYATSTGCSS